MGSIETDHEYMAEPYQSSDDALLGFRFQTLISSEPWINNDQIILCMNTNDINQHSITSNNVQFMLSNNEIITCQNNPNQHGLPCKTSNTLPIDSNHDEMTGSDRMNVEKIKQQTKNSINSDDSSDNEQHELLNGFDDKRKEINVELKSSEKLSPGLTPKTRQYIKFAFV